MNALEPRTRPYRESLMLLTAKDIETGREDISEREVLEKALSDIQSRLLKLEFEEIFSKNEPTKRRS